MNDVLIITKDMVRNGKYVGTADVSNWRGAIEIDAGLGFVKFKGSIRASRYIYAKAGSGIKAGWDIKAGEGIEAGEGIKAGWGIEAGWDIKAGEGIEAGEGIKAGLAIASKYISSGMRIFAGVAVWKIPSAEEMQIRAKVIKGDVCYGEIVEPAEVAAKDNCDGKIVEIEGKRYRLVSDDA